MSINILLTTVTVSWGPSELERAMCAICHHTLFSVFSPVLKIIDTLTGQLGKRSSKGLLACTTEVCAVRLHNHPVHGDRLVLVDTPGFTACDNNIDFEILQIVSKWLQKV